MDSNINMLVYFVCQANIQKLHVEVEVVLTSNVFPVIFCALTAALLVHKVESSTFFMPIIYVWLQCIFCSFCAFIATLLVHGFWTN